MMNNNIAMKQEANRTNRNRLKFQIIINKLQSIKFYEKIMIIVI